MLQPTELPSQGSDSFGNIVLYSNTCGVLFRTGHWGTEDTAGSKTESCTHGVLLARKKKKIALAGVAQWAERRPANQRVTDLIPSQGTCLG